MKALSLIGLVFAVFLLALGYTSRKTAGDVLGIAVMIGGACIGLFVIGVWIILYIKEKKEKENGSDF